MEKQQNDKFIKDMTELEKTHEYFRATSKNNEGQPAAGWRREWDARYIQWSNTYSFVLWVERYSNPESFAKPDLHRKPGLVLVGHYSVWDA